MTQKPESIEARCCVAGGGPAGMMIGFLLARAGVDVVVLEKHADFLRDFRGDTVHPSTLELMYELGIIDDFLRRPHQEFPQIAALIDDFSVTVADFSHLPTHCKFVALMPQWDFLNFIAEKAKLYPQFNLRMEAAVTDLLMENGRVRGVRATTPQGALEVRAQLTIGADGRHSKVREVAQLEVIDLGAPIDVLWMRLARKPGDLSQTLGRFREGKILVSLDRDDYCQCAYVIQKGEFDSIQRKGLPAFRETIESVAPFLRGRTDELRSWDDIKLLSVAVDRLRHWSRAGLLCIGDSAHAMSPVGGVGINLAIQDAVATANLLAVKLRAGTLRAIDLDRVRRRRSWPARVIQRVQVTIHNRVLDPVISGTARALDVPLPIRILDRLPSLRRWPAQLLGVGLRPEHVRSPDTTADIAHISR
jgi:2-polyprenyl-6-methoxyphenol hydroxylase-like FAD-dependent oxidoreductase